MCRFTLAPSGGGDDFPVAGIGQGDHRRYPLGFHQRAVVEFGKGAAHRSPRFAGPFGDRTARRVCLVPAGSDAVFFDRHVESVATYPAFG